MAPPDGHAPRARGRLPLLLTGRRVLFFGGKGGVGKTTLAAAFALQSAEQGDETLLVSADPAHSTSDMLDHPLGSEPVEVLPRLHALEIDPAAEADRYIADVKDRVQEATSPRLRAEVERQIDAARVSPGAEEAALFDRFAALMQQAGGVYDRIIFDTAPTGQTLRLLSLPELMTAWIDGMVSRRRKVSALGRMWRNVASAAAGSPDTGEDPVLRALEARRDRFRRAREVVTDRRRTTFIFVLTPERLPIEETRRAVRVLDRHGIHVGGVIVNRVLPEEAAGSFLERRRQQEQEYLREIETGFGQYPLLRVPLQEEDVKGLRALRQIMAALPREPDEA